MFTSKITSTKLRFMQAASRSFGAKIPKTSNLTGFIHKYQSEGYKIAARIDPLGITNAYSE